MNIKILLGGVLFALLLVACLNNVSSTEELPMQPEVKNTVDDSRTVYREQDSEANSIPNFVATVADSFTEVTDTNRKLLILYGQVLDVNGNPVDNAAVEIWQTDASGVYDHPNDPSTARRDTTFQFYGTSATDKEGWYAFRTVLPGRYEPRPRHIHFKVKQADKTLLTSQFYFQEDIAQVRAEGMFYAVGDSGNLLLLQPFKHKDTLMANGQIVVDTDIGEGTLPLTPSQAEGPYYPVVSLANYDNDLVTLN